MDTKFVTSLALYLFTNFHVIIPCVSVLTATKPKAKNNFPYSRHVFTFPEIVILLTSEFFHLYFFLILKYGDWCYILLSGSRVRYLVGDNRRKLKTWSWGVLQWRVFVLKCVKFGKLSLSLTHSHTHTRTHTHTHTRTHTHTHMHTHAHTDGVSISNAYFFAFL